MSTLFVGRLRNKGDRLIAAAPQIGAGFQQAGDALRQYEADRQNQQKEEMLRAATVAKISGSWANTSQEFKNELPRIFGMDFNRDPITNDVIIDKSFDELLQDRLRNAAMNDPELGLKWAMIDNKLMSP